MINLYVILVPTLNSPTVTIVKTQSALSAPISFILTLKIHVLVIVEMVTIKIILIKLLENVLNVMMRVPSALVL